MRPLPETERRGGMMRSLLMSRRPAASQAARSPPGLAGWRAGWHHSTAGRRGYGQAVAKHVVANRCHRRRNYWGLLRSLTLAPSATIFDPYAAAVGQGRVCGLCDWIR